MIRNRIELANYFKELGFTKGAEIGVADGRYSEILLQTIPNLKLSCIDLWRPYENNWRKQDYHNEAYQKTLERIRPYPDATAIPFPSIEASVNVQDESLDFVFIDGSHTFDHVMTDIIIWSRKVKKGGIVAGHDYYHFHDSGVVEAVNKYTEEHKIDLNLTLWNSADHKDDQCPCWWFMKK